MEEKAVTVASDSETNNAPTVEEKKEEKITDKPQPSSINRASSGKGSESMRSKSSGNRRKRSNSRSPSTFVVSESSSSRSRSPSRHKRNRANSQSRKSRSRSASPAKPRRNDSRSKSLSRRQQQPADQVHEDCTKIHVVLQDVQETAESITTQPSAVEIAQVPLNILCFTYRERNHEKQGVPITQQNKSILKKTATLAIQNLAAARLSQGFGLHCNNCNKDLITTSQNSLLSAHVCSMCLTTVWCDGKCHDLNKFAHQMVCIETKAYSKLEQRPQYSDQRSQSSGVSSSFSPVTPVATSPSLPPITAPIQQRNTCRFPRWPSRGQRTQVPSDDWVRNMRSNEICHQDVINGNPFFWHNVRGCYVLKNDRDRDCRKRMSSDFVQCHRNANATQRKHHNLFRFLSIIDVDRFSHTTQTQVHTSSLSLLVRYVCKGGAE
jgi:hypothetical protein